jgi:hypothetical protein
MSTQLLFAGFLLTPSKMGWLLFMHYISLFAYGLRSLAQNEFLSDKYSTVDAGQTQSRGKVILDVSAKRKQMNRFDSVSSTDGLSLYRLFASLKLQTFEIRTDGSWLWGGVAFCAGFFLLTNVVSGIAMAYVRIERNIGTFQRRPSSLVH